MRPRVATVDARLDAIREVARALPGLELLVLHGSRSRGDAHEGSDWDFAYLAGLELDELALRAGLAEALHTDDVDVLDLARAGGLVRYRVAGDGIVCFERERGAFEKFAYPAILFWLDAQHVIRPAYEAVLKDLG
jgi:predicted nucleotidyltransferase